MNNNTLPEFSVFGVKGDFSVFMQMADFGKIARQKKAVHDIEDPFSVVSSEGEYEKATRWTEQQHRIKNALAYFGVPNIYSNFLGSHGKFEEYLSGPFRFMSTSIDGQSGMMGRIAEARLLEVMLLDKNDSKVSSIDSVAKAAVRAYFADCVVDYDIEGTPYDITLVALLDDSDYLANIKSTQALRIFDNMKKHHILNVDSIGLPDVSTFEVEGTGQLFAKLAKVNFANNPYYWP
jgi:hypothetical protein